MSKVYYLTSRAGAAMYTAATVRHMMRMHGIAEVDSARAADAVWCSVCDPDDLGVLKNARRRAGDAPVFMGGFEGIFPYPYLAFADYVVMGVGEGFIADFARDAQRASGRYNVISQQKLIGSPDYEIDYSQWPLLRAPGGSRYIYIAARGCRNKCRFCATGWTQPHTENSNVAIAKAARIVERNGGYLKLVSNEDVSFAGRVKIPSVSITANQYVANPGKHRAQRIRIGVEGWTERDRAWFGKPIPDNMLKEIVLTSKALNHVIVLFFIVGYPGWSIASVDEMIEWIPEDCSVAPRIELYLTYFDPCPHTPLADCVVNPAFCDTKKLFFRLNRRNKRIRVYPVRSAGRAAWRTCFHRCTPEEAIILGGQPNDSNTESSFPTFVEDLRQKGLEDLLCRVVDWSGIHVRYK